MKIVITGSSGYLGSRVAAAALDRGHEVVGIDMKPSGNTQKKYNKNHI